MKTYLFLFVCCLGAYWGCYSLALGIRQLDINLQVIGTALLTMSLATLRKRQW